MRRNLGGGSRPVGDREGAPMLRNRSAVRSPDMTDRRGRWLTFVTASCLALLVAASILTPSSHAEGRCGSHPWCNTSLSPDERATLLLGAMSQSDKIGVLTGKEASDVGMAPIKWTDGAVGAGGLGSGSNPATAMPAAIALAAKAATETPQMMPQRTPAVHPRTPAAKSEVLLACGISIWIRYRSGDSLGARQLRRGLSDIACGNRLEKSPATGSSRRW